MLPVPPGDVAAWKNVEQFDVCRQSDADVAAFEQIMTEQMRLRKSPRQQAMKCLQIVNAFAVITPFTSQILVNVGDCMGVRVDPARIGEDA